jgi:hypothetical protein
MSDPNRPWTKQPYAGSSSLTNADVPIAANLLRGQDGSCRHRGINRRHPSSSASRLSGRWPGIITERPRTRSSPSCSPSPWPTSCKMTGIALSSGLQAQACLFVCRSGARARRAV